MMSTTELFYNSKHVAFKVTRVRGTGDCQVMVL